MEKILRDAVRGAFPGDPLDVVLLLANVLDIERRHDADALVEQIADILPALRISAAGRVALRQTVDQADLRMAAEESHQIDCALVGLRNHFQTVDDGLNLGRDRGLKRGHHHILPAHLAAAALIEHAQRLAHARRVAQKDLQPSARFAALARLNAAQQLAGIGPAVVQPGHGLVKADEAAPKAFPEAVMHGAPAESQIGMGDFAGLEVERRARFRGELALRGRWR